MQSVKYIISQGKLCDLHGIVNLYDTLIDALVEGGINYPGWKKHIYPNEEVAIQGIETGTIYVIKDCDKIIGTVILDNCQPDAYSKLQWNVTASNAEVFVVHTLAVHPNYFKRGIAMTLLKFIDDIANRKKAKAIRLDVYKDNIPAIELYEKCGYALVGEVDLGLSIYGLDLFKCYEKAIF